MNKHIFVQLLEKYLYLLYIWFLYEIFHLLSGMEYNIKMHLITKTTILHVDSRSIYIDIIL